MSYEPTNWENGDIITAEKLNKIENGIEAINDSDLFICKISIEYPSMVVTCSKTYSEIDEAYGEHKVLLFKIYSSVLTATTAICTKATAEDCYFVEVNDFSVTSGTPGEEDGKFHGLSARIDITPQSATVGKIESVEIKCKTSKIYPPN